MWINFIRKCRIYGRNFNNIKVININNTINIIIKKYIRKKEREKYEMEY